MAVFSASRKKKQKSRRGLPPSFSASACSRFFHHLNSLFGWQVERGADEFLNLFLTGEPQTEQGALVLRIATPQGKCQKLKLTLSQAAKLLGGRALQKKR